MTESDNQRFDDKVLEKISKVSLSKGQKTALTDIALGYVGNTAVSLLCVAAIEKFAPKQLEAVTQWQTDKYEKKWEKERKGEYEALGSDEAKAEWKENLHAEARIRAEKQVKAYMLCSGGFAMIPFQAFADVTISSGEDHVRRKEHFYDKVEFSGKFDFDKIDKANYDQLKTEDWPILSWNQKRLAYAESSGMDRVKAGRELLAESTLSDSMRNETLKWGLARATALKAAFTMESFVQDNYVEERDAIANFIAKTITRVTGKARGQEKGYVDPNIHKQVDLALTDAYMSATAIVTTRAFNNTWELAKKGGELIQAAHSTGITQKDDSGKYSYLAGLMDVIKGQSVSASI